MKGIKSGNGQCGVAACSVWVCRLDPVFLGYSRSGLDTVNNIGSREPPGVDSAVVAHKSCTELILRRPRLPEAPFPVIAPL